MGATQTGTTTVDESAKSPSKEEKKEDKPHKVIGRYAGAEQPDAASSGDAAADTLKSLFKR